MGGLEDALNQRNGEASEHQRKMAAWAAESDANTREFVLKMRSLGHKTLALYLRFSSDPVIVKPKRWQRQPATPPDTRKVFRYDMIGRGWAVSLADSDGGNNHAFVMNTTDPTVYNVDAPSSSDNMYTRPDDLTVIEYRSFLIDNLPHNPGPDRARAERLFSGDYGLRLLADAVEAKGLPGVGTWSLPPQ